MANIIEILIRAKDKSAKTFEQSQKGLEKYRAGLTKIGLVAGVATGAAAAGLTKLMKDTVQFGDLMAKTSTRVGMSAETLSRLHFVAERTGSVSALRNRCSCSVQ